jgi:hypothetical protein
MTTAPRHHSSIFRFYLSADQGWWLFARAESQEGTTSGIYGGLRELA